MHHADTRKEPVTEKNILFVFVLKKLKIDFRLRESIVFSSNAFSLLDFKNAFRILNRIFIFHILYIVLFELLHLLPPAEFPHFFHLVSGD